MECLAITGHPVIPLLNALDKDTIQSLDNHQEVIRSITTSPWLGTSLPTSPTFFVGPLLLISYLFDWVHVESRNVE